MTAFCEHNNWLSLSVATIFSDTKGRNAAMIHVRDVKFSVILEYNAYLQYYMQRSAMTRCD